MGTTSGRQGQDAIGVPIPRLTVRGKLGEQKCLRRSKNAMDGKEAEEALRFGAIVPYYFSTNFSYD
jgi:hypothetical protein